MRKLTVLLLAVLLCGIMGMQASAKSEYRKIGIEIDGSKLGAEAYSADGRTMVPMRAIFEKLQSDVEWDQETRSVTAKKGTTTIRLTIDDESARVGNKTVKLDVPPMIIDGTTFVPLRFVSESLGAEVEYSSKRNIVSVRTAGGSAPSPSGSGSGSNPGPVDPPKRGSLKVEPYVVQGYATDKQGHPLEGVEILADNMLERNSYMKAYTDENGYYRIEFPKSKRPGI